MPDQDTTAPSVCFTRDVTEAEWHDLLAHVRNEGGRVITSCPITIKGVPGYCVKWEQ